MMHISTRSYRSMVTVFTFACNSCFEYAMADESQKTNLLRGRNVHNEMKGMPTRLVGEEGAHEGTTNFNKRSLYHYWDGDEEFCQHPCDDDSQCGGECSTCFYPNEDYYNSERRYFNSYQGYYYYEPCYYYNEEPCYYYLYERRGYCIRDQLYDDGEYFANSMNTNTSSLGNATSSDGVIDVNNTHMDTNLTNATVDCIDFQTSNTTSVMLSNVTNVNGTMVVKAANGSNWEP